MSPEARMMTDNARWYRKIMKKYASHETVNHSKGEYVRGDVHTNTIEGVFSIFKRGMIGTYQHCGEQHLQRYLAEFDHRYNHREVQAKAIELHGQGNQDDQDSQETDPFKRRPNASQR